MVAPTRDTRLAHPVRRKPRAIIFAFMLTLVLAACGDDNGNTSSAAPPTPPPSPAPGETPIPTPTFEPGQHYGVLDGIPMEGSEFDRRASLAPVAIMVDNHPAAYPQQGLDRADLVYETFVEGQFTRYLAVYWRKDSEHVEPVRSARVPFVHWTYELDAILAQVGAATYSGEANAIQRAREWQIPVLDHDQAIGPPAFRRTTERRPPHNVAADTRAIRQEADARGIAPAAEFDVSELDRWQFKDPGEGIADLPAAGRINVRYSSQPAGGTVVEWRWDEDAGSYARYRDGEPHRDAGTGEQLMFTNVAVMNVPARTVSPHGHVVFDQVGDGAATVYLDGKRIDARWEKPSESARTRFYDGDGFEVAFTRGPTWVHMVAPASIVEDSAP